MNTTEATSEIELEDVPWPSWAIAGCLAVVIAVVGARIWLMWEDATNRELSLQLALVMILSVSFLAFATKSAVSCAVDRMQRTITIGHGGLLNSTSQELQFREVATCFTEHWDQSDGTVYRICLRLRSGETLPITSWKRNQKNTDQLCHKIRRAIGSS